MKKIILICALLHFAINDVYSQAADIEVNWGPVMKTKDSDFNNIIGSNDQFFYTVGYQSTGISIGAFRVGASRDLVIKKYSRENYRALKTTVVEKFEYQDEKAMFFDAILEGNIVHLYYRVYNNKIDKKFMISRTISESGVVSAPSEISEVPADKKYEADFNMYTSKDSTKILVFANLPYEKHESEKFSMTVLDMNYNVLWTREVTLPYTDKYFGIVESTVSNNGDVFVLGYATPDKTKGERKKRKTPNESYKLLRINGEDEIVEFDLGLDDIFVTSPDILADFKDETMTVSGFYSKEDRGAIGGSFYITVDQNLLEAKTASREPFSKKFLQNFMSERKAKKGRELGAFKFKEFVRRDDGGAVIVAEQEYTYITSTTTANGATTYTTYYVNNDIIVININPDGSIEWSTYIAKEQTTSSTGFYLSYVMLVEGSRLHFIYNDDRKNLERLGEGKDVKTMKNPKKSVSVIATVDSEGNVSYDQLFRNKDMSAILVPKKCMNTSEGNALIYGVKGSKTRFGEISFR